MPGDHCGGGSFGGSGRWPLLRQAMKLSFGISQFCFDRNSKIGIQRTKHMKRLLTLTGIVSVGAILTLMTACQTTGTT
ncbi:MAG TPA: hypothetical protein VJR28_04620, partial [Chthoniobacterales bacterium]|nr:hypothetical protein [Chthoniobacterales bacterium]